MLLAVSMVGMLAGCGSSSSDSTASSEASSSADTSAAATTTAATEAATEAETSESTADGDVVELSVWHYFGDSADAAKMEEVVQTFNDEHPNIHVTATYVSREELMNQYTVGAVSGELPDIGQVDSPDMESYISLGVFQDITDELTEWGETDNYYSGPLSSCKDADGKLYGLPQNSNCLALAVNMDVLNAAGIEEAPSNVDEFKDAVEATTDAGSSTFGFALSAISTEEGTFQLLPWICATHDGTKGSIADITSDACVQGLQMLGDFAANGNLSKESVNWTQADAYNQFVAGKAALAEIGTWHLATIDDDINGAFNYEVVLLPTGDEGTSSSTIGGENFGICSGTEHKAEAVEFLEYICGADVQKEWDEEAGKLPTRSDVTPEYSHDQEWFEVFQDEMNYAMARGPHAEWPTISQAIYTAAQSVIVNGESAEDALQTANETIAPILEESPLPEQ